MTRIPDPESVPARPRPERCEGCGHHAAEDREPLLGVPAQLCQWCVARMLDLDETEDKRWRWTGREWVRA